jgi:hypothetical protein
MKVKLPITIILMFVLMTAFVSAPGISGEWNGIMTLPGGNTRTIHYIFKADGNTLTGSTQSPGRNEYELSSGKIWGDSLSFSIVVDNGDSILNTGKYYHEGDSINLAVVFMGATLQATLKRAGQGSGK